MRTKRAHKWALTNWNLRKCCEIRRLSPSPMLNTDLHHCDSASDCWCSVQIRAKPPWYPPTPQKLFATAPLCWGFTPHVTTITNIMIKYSYWRFIHCIFSLTPRVDYMLCTYTFTHAHALWSQMISNDLKWSQIITNDLKLSQMISNVLKMIANDRKLTANVRKLRLLWLFAIIFDQLRTFAIILRLFVIICDHFGLF